MSIAAVKIADGAINRAKVSQGTVIANIPVAGTSQTAESNRSYLATNDAATTITLPTTASAGDIVNVAGTGFGGWSVVPGVGHRLVAPWVPRNPEKTWAAVAASSDGSRVLAAAYFDRIYISTNAGATWTPRESNRAWVSVAMSDNGVKLVAVVSSGQIYTSSDSGANWTPWDSNRTWRAVASSDDGSKLVAVVANGQIYTSPDSGQSWTPRESNRNWSAVASSNNGNKLVAAVINGLIYTSTDAGVSWIPRTIGSRAWRSVGSSSDGATLIAADSNSGIFTSTDSGLSWTQRAFGNTGDFGVAISADGSKMTSGVLFNAAIQTSTVFGVTWMKQQVRPSTNFAFKGLAMSSNGRRFVAFGEGPVTSTLRTRHPR